MKQSTIQKPNKTAYNIENTQQDYLPECAFRFNYLAAQSPDYAEQLVNELEEDK